MDETQQIPFCVFGLQRTGTNLIRLLMLQNFNTVSNETAGDEWKHGYVIDPNRQFNGIPMRFVMCVKNPYSWLFSTYRFFRENIQILVDDRLIKQFDSDPDMPLERYVRSPTYDFKSPVHRWNMLNRHWLDVLPTDRRFIVRQEDQVLDQEKVLTNLGKALGLTAKQTPFIVVNRRVSVRMRTDDPLNYDYYRNHDYLKQFTPELLKHVNDLLDWDLMARFNYARQESTDFTEPAAPGAAR